MPGMSRKESAAINDKIRTLYSEGWGSRRIAAELNLDPVVVYKRLRRIGINRSFSEHYDKLKVEKQIAPFNAQPLPANLRKAAIGTAIQWFQERGYAVSVPVDPTTYDLVVESDQGFQKIQVKTTTARNRGGSWTVQVHRWRYDSEAVVNASGKRRRVGYVEGEVDFFFVVVSNGSSYLLPLEVVGGALTVCLDRKYAEFQVCSGGGMADTQP